MIFRGGKISTGEMGNFHPALTLEILLCTIVAMIALRMCKVLHNQGSKSHGVRETFATFQEALLVFPEAVRV